MKLIFGAQGSILKIFSELDCQLRERGVVDQSAYWISDSSYFYSNRHIIPILSDTTVCQLHEWRFTPHSDGAAKVDDLERRRLDRRYGVYNLWNAIVSDRRLMYGSIAKVRQDYECKFSQDQLVDIIYSSLSALDKLADELGPNAVITFVPATYGDYLLYLVARAKGIPYLQLRSTKIRNFVLFSDGIEALPKRVKRQYLAKLAQRNGYKFEDEARSYLRSGSKAPVIYEGTLRSDEDGLLKRSIAILSGLGSAIKRTLRPIHQDVKYDNHVAPAFASYLHYVLLKKYHENRSKNQMDSRLISTKDLSAVSYVFFPLHSEPEIAISVYGRDYQNQIELVRKLAQSLPLTWRLVIKEHPRTLSYRSQGYYKRLLEIPNLYFADPKTKPFYLIEGSKAVATISGFVGFEALMAGRPVLVFGDVSYSILPSNMVRKVCKKTDIYRELIDLISNFKLDKNALKAFVAANLEEGVPINLYSELLAKEGRSTFEGNSKSQQLSALTDLLQRHLEDFTL